MGDSLKLIYADEAFEAITDLAGQASTKSAYAAFWEAGRVVQKLQPVDAKPVTYGHWIERCNRGLYDFKYECSVCSGGSDLSSKYCPDCGATMTGDIELREEVDLGEWLEDYEVFLDDSGNPSSPIHTGYVCSKCGEGGYPHYEFCYSCGKPMRRCV